MPLWKGKVFVFAGLVSVGVSNSACCRTNQAKPELPALEKSVRQLRQELAVLRAQEHAKLQKVNSADCIAVPALEAHRVQETKLELELSRRTLFQRDMQLYSFPDQKSVWGRKATIAVCWENVAPEQKSFRVRVQRDIANSWEAAAAIAFTGWGLCTENSSDSIRIAVQDTDPHTKHLGRFLAGVPSGMVLNFTFANWGHTLCSGNPGLCLDATAIHEFGHALGFSHEQNRPDTPAWCTESPQGDDGDLVLSQWDPDSIMNYCRAGWRTAKWTEPWLSKGDIEAVQGLYGKRASS